MRAYAQDDESIVEDFIGRVLEGREELDRLVDGSHRTKQAEVLHVLAQWAAKGGIATAEEYEL